MTDMEQRKAAKHFAEFWKGKGYEKGESQKFWLSLLGEVYGVEHPAEYISFEDQVHLDHTSFIDGYIPRTRVLIEQKGLGKDLLKPIKQSDGSLLTPFQQAKRYITELPVDSHPKRVITCNFERFLIYDMNRPNGEPEEILLENLPTEYYRMNFLVDTGDANIKREMEISMQAGELVGKLYDAFLKQYKDPTNESTLKSLNALCVRLVFCLYAEDAGIFGKHNMFHDFLRNRGMQKGRKALRELFRILDQKIEERDPYLAEDDPELAAFPYVNGGLFSDEDIEIPPFNEEIYNLLLTRASEDFNWSEISPTIFGAVFESTLNPDTRRKGGMHYTSIENIHKVIDPLFLDDLRAELNEIKQVSAIKTRERRLEAFQDKLASLKFLDPACGSGNFLTETYLSLRKLENEVLSLLLGGQIALGFGELNPIKVSIAQFYGIEINDFAATVAKTALWIAESQMMKQTEDIVHMNLDFLPLKSYVNIVEGNALRIDWETVVQKAELSYIMGNPPFVGHNVRTEQQKDDLKHVFGNIQTDKSDYVIAWFYKAGCFVANTDIKVAFVATNSVCQGVSVGIIWKALFEMGMHINFAWPTFVWNNESSDQAHVHVVIVGYSSIKTATPTLYGIGVGKRICANINGYLVDAPDVCIERRTAPICKVPRIKTGSLPRSSGFTVTAEDRPAFIADNPLCDKWIRPYIGSDEFINKKERYCLWLKGANVAELRKCKMVMERVNKVREDRLASPAATTRRTADTPTLFAVDAQPDTDYLLIPQVSSERRKYIPIGFMSSEVIASNLVFVVPNATIYHFGILTSNVHNAWMRTVCGRMKSDYRYGGDTVYNNFPWPTPTDAQKAKIEQTAQAILDARALYPDCSLADLYDDVAMPPELRKAHQQNDKAVMEAYGMSVRETTEASCVAELMRRYQELTR